MWSTWYVSKSVGRGSAISDCLVLNAFWIKKDKRDKKIKRNKINKTNKTRQSEIADPRPTDLVTIMTLRPFQRYTTRYGVQRFVNDLDLDPGRTATIFTRFLPKSGRTEPRIPIHPFNFQADCTIPLSYMSGQTNKQTQMQ